MRNVYLCLTGFFIWLTGVLFLEGAAMFIFIMLGSVLFGATISKAVIEWKKSNPNYVEPVKPRKPYYAYHKEINKHGGNVTRIKSEPERLEDMLKRLNIKYKIDYRDKTDSSGPK